MRMVGEESIAYALLCVSTTTMPCEKVDNNIWPTTCFTPNIQYIGITYMCVDYIYILYIIYYMYVYEFHK